MQMLPFIKVQVALCHESLYLSNDKVFSTPFPFGFILEENLIKEVINKQQ